MPFGGAGELKRLGEAGWFSLLGCFLHIKRAMGTRGGSELVGWLTGSKQLNLALTSYVRAGIGKPTADDFTGGHSIGLHREGIGDAHPFRFDNRGMCLVNRFDYFGQMGLIHQFAVAEWRTLLGYFDGMTCGIHAEEVWASVAEITFLSIDHFPFQHVACFPVSQLLICYIGDVGLDIVAYLLLCPAEIYAQPFL